MIFFKKATLTSFLIQYFDNLLFFGRAKWSFSEQNESSSARHFVPLSPVHLLHCPCCRRKRSPSQRCSQVPSSLSGIRSANSAAPWCTGRFRCTSLDSRLQGEDGVAGAGDEGERSGVFYHRWHTGQGTRSSAHTHTRTRSYGYDRAMSLNQFNHDMVARWRYRSLKNPLLCAFSYLCPSCNNGMAANWCARMDKGGKKNLRHGPHLIIIIAVSLLLITYDSVYIMGF